MQLALYRHDAFLDHDTGQHPECISRVEACEQRLRGAKDLEGQIEWREAGDVADEAILRCHAPWHLQAVHEIDGRSGSFDPDTVYSPGSHRAILRSAGSVVDAAERCLRDEIPGAFCLSRPPGHHATANRAMGFCFLNNVAIAARHLRDLGCPRVLIVDWDVHHGNGTQAIFWEDPSVFYYSLHQSPHYPGTGHDEDRGTGEGTGTTLNRPLPAGFPPDRFRELFETDIEEILESFEPTFVLISAGFDSHREDPLGGLLLEEEDYEAMTRFITSRMPRGRIVSALEGGYHLDALSRSVHAHVRGLLPS